VGALIDRFGNRRVMIASQLLVASSMLFYLSAPTDRWWWIFGASTMFIAYAGLNVGIPNLMLKLSPPHERNAYIASYYSWAGLAYSCGSLAGGIIYDAAAKVHLGWKFAGLHFAFDHFALFFFLGLVLRGALALLIYAIDERGATTLNSPVPSARAERRVPVQIG
jgi:MFS family permease